MLIYKKYLRPISIIFVILSLFIAQSKNFKLSNDNYLNTKSKIKAQRSDVIQNQLRNLFNQIKGKNIAILTNPTAVDGNQKLLFQRILQRKQQFNFTIKCFFAPEHGLRGDKQAGDGDSDYVDQQTGIIVYSLYGVRTAPQKYQLSGVDLFLYDIQDVGTRFYTYIWTLTYTIVVLSQLQIPLLIFDRPNPLGRKLQGCPLLLNAGLIGRLLPNQRYSIPQRYGLTIGQFIGFQRQYLSPKFKYQVIKMSQWYEIEDCEWVLSSPNMPTLSTAFVYPGMGIFEGTTISEGRGTTKPFQLSGFPNITANEILKYFQRNNIKVDGAILRQAYFIPTYSKHLNEICGGVQIHVKDKQKFNGVFTSLNLLKAYLSLNPNITISPHIDNMFGFNGFHSMIQNNASIQQIMKQCQFYAQIYEKQYKKYWLYN